MRTTRRRRFIQAAFGLGWLAVMDFVPAGLAAAEPSQAPYFRHGEVAQQEIRFDQQTQ
jgi:hypothetical protein